MYGEMVSLRARARALREIADELTARARTLSDQTDGMKWRSPAGDAFRDQLRVLVGDLASHASALQTAADALERHASAVDGAKRAIQDAQSWVTARLNDAVRTVRAAGETTVGAFEHAMAAAGRNAPPSGSSEWLDFRQLFEKRGWA